MEDLSLKIEIPANTSAMVIIPDWGKQYDSGIGNPGEQGGDYYKR